MSFFSCGSICCHTPVPADGSGDGEVDILLLLSLVHVDVEVLVGVDPAQPGQPGRPDVTAHHHVLILAVAVLGRQQLSVHEIYPDLGKKKKMMLLIGLKSLPPETR